MSLAKGSKNRIKARQRMACEQSKCTYGNGHRGNRVPLEKNHRWEVKLQPEAVGEDEDQSSGGVCPKTMRGEKKNEPHMKGKAEGNALIVTPKVLGCLLLPTFVSVLITTTSVGRWGSEKAQRQGKIGGIAGEGFGRLDKGGEENHRKGHDCWPYCAIEQRLGQPKNRGNPARNPAQPEKRACRNLHSGGGHCEERGWKGGGKHPKTTGNQTLKT